MSESKENKNSPGQGKHTVRLDSDVYKEVRRERERRLNEGDIATLGDIVSKAWRELKSRTQSPAAVALPAAEPENTDSDKESIDLQQQDNEQQPEGSAFTIPKDRTSLESSLRGCGLFLDKEIQWVCILLGILRGDEQLYIDGITANLTMVDRARRVAAGDRPGSAHAGAAVVSDIEGAVLEFIAGAESGNQSTDEIQQRARNLAEQIKRIKGDKPRNRRKAG